MNIFEGKSPTERNKIIAAILLGVLALGSLFFAFGGSVFSSGANVRVSVSPTPKMTPPPNRRSDDLKMPSIAEQNFDYTTTPISYNAGHFYAPDPGRNIFAFYEPPPPCPTCPTPVPPPVVVPPTPEPTPYPIQVAFIQPQSVYAGSAKFRLELNGDKFEPNARVYFSQSELPTTFINAQKIVAEVPANLISAEGPRQIIVQTTDGTKYSNQIMLNVQAPPKPQFLYVGAILRQRGNNDTGVFREQGQNKPEFSARLNDVVSGRFRLVSISAEKSIFEDVNLGFRHTLPLDRPAPGSASSSFPNRGDFPVNDGFPSYNPNSPNNPNFQPQQIPMPQSIPGIPDNIPRYVPPNSNMNNNRPVKKEDVDDEDGDN